MFDDTNRGMDPLELNADIVYRAEKYRVDKGIPAKVPQQEVIELMLKDYRQVTENVAKARKEAKANGKKKNIEEKKQEIVPKNGKENSQE